MRKSVKRMGMEALCWEIVQIEVALKTFQTFRTAFLSTIQQMPNELPEVSESIMQVIHKLETDQRERMARLELEQARREREFLLTDCREHSIASVLHPSTGQTV